MFEYDSEIYITTYSFLMEVSDRSEYLRNIMGDHLRDGMTESLNRYLCEKDEKYPVCGKCEQQKSCLFPPLFLPVDSDGKPVSRPLVLWNVRPGVREILEQADMSCNDDPLRRNNSILLPGETWLFNLTLIGDHREKFPYYLTALLNPRSPKFPRSCLKAVFACRIQDDSFHSMYSREESYLNNVEFPFTLQDAYKMADSFSGNRIVVDFVTQTRLKESNDFVSGAPSFRTLINAIADRISKSYPGEQWKQTPVISPELLEEAHKIKIIKQNIHYTNSISRKTRRGFMHLNGILGQVTYQGENLKSFLPYMIFGSYLQVGKNTVMGCGKYLLAQ